MLEKKRHKQYYYDNSHKMKMQDLRQFQLRFTLCLPSVVLMSGAVKEKAKKEKIKIISIQNNEKTRKISN